MLILVLLLLWLIYCTQRMENKLQYMTSDIVGSIPRQRIKEKDTVCDVGTISANVAPTWHGKS